MRVLDMLTPLMPRPASRVSRTHPRLTRLVVIGVPEKALATRLRVSNGEPSMSELAARFARLSKADRLWLLSEAERLWASTSKAPGITGSL